MIKTVNMPKLGHLMEEGTVVRWHLHAGDYVSKGDVLLEVANDKSVIEVESFITGKLLQVLVIEEQTVPVGTPLAVVDESSATGR